MRQIALLLLLLFLTLSPQLTAQADTNKPTNGVAFSVALAVHDDYAYYANSYTLSVYDVSDFENPHPVASLEVNETDFFQDVTWADDHLFLSAENESFIFDVSDPTNPTLIDVATQTNAVGVIARSPYLFQSNWTNWGEFRVYDISDPTMPVEVGSTASNYHHFELLDDTAFLGDVLEGNIDLIDVSSPTTPTPSTTWNFTDLATFAVDTDTAFIATQSCNATTCDVTIEVWDTSDIHNPQALGSHTYALPPLPDYYPLIVMKMIVDGDTLYVGTLENGVFTLDISDPTDPTPLNNYDVSLVADMVWQDGLLYLATLDTPALTILDFRDTSAITLANGTATTANTPWLITLIGIVFLILISHRIIFPYAHFTQ